MRELTSRMRNRLSFSLNKEQKPTSSRQRKFEGGKLLMNNPFLTHRISLNGLKRYADSNEIFKLTKQSSKDKSIGIWIAKNNAALAKRSLPLMASYNTSFG